MSRNDNAPVASQEARSAEKAWPNGYSITEARLDRLREAFPDKRIPWGMLKTVLGSNTDANYKLAREHGYVIVKKQPEARKIREGFRMRQVREYVNTHYPCMVLPRGAVVDIATAVGTTRQQTWAITKRLGIPIARPTYAHRTKEPVCHNCGSPRDRKGSLCNTCYWVNLICPSCEKEYAMSRTELLQRSRQHARTKATRDPGTFLTCSKTCRKDRGVAYMREHPRASAADIMEMFGVGATTVSTWKKLMTGP